MVKQEFYSPPAYCWEMVLRAKDRALIHAKDDREGCAPNSVQGPLFREVPT